MSFYYAPGGQLWLALWGQRTADANGQYVPDSYSRLAAREVRGSGRARYLLRDVRHELDPDVFPAAFEPRAVVLSRPAA